MSTSPSGYVTAFGEVSVPTPGLEGGVGCNHSRVAFDGKVRFLGLRDCVKKGEKKESARGSVHWGCDYATIVDVEVDPQRRRFSRRESDCYCCCCFRKKCEKNVGCSTHIVDLPVLQSYVAAFHVGRST
jgi:hypothetical protein